MLTNPLFWLLICLIAGMVWAVLKILRIRSTQIRKNHMSNDSYLHAWVGQVHCFTGTMNSQTTEAELITADEEWLEHCKTQLIKQVDAVAEQPKLADLVVETTGKETCLRFADGRKHLSFFRH